jgi:hypothetical protein
MARVTITLTDSRKVPGEIEWKMVCRDVGKEEGSAAFAVAQKMIALMKHKKERASG